MCIFTGIFYCECGHVSYEVFAFCSAFLDQLLRINDPGQREQYLLPFDPGDPDCEPYCLFTRYGYPAVANPPGSGNVVWWVFDLAEPCLECAQVQEL
ncbi:hypothetical protein F1880_000566 [Penicillium rolfsii]|nr:hypothetical protein F1880_000566 [Penicillium rolfsii]